MADKARIPWPALLGVALAFVIAIGGGGWYVWMQTPQYAVGQMLKAQADRDVEAFATWVDLDAVSEQVVVLGEGRLDEAMEKLAGMAGQWGGGVRAMASKKRGEIRDGLKGFVQDAIRERVAAGTFSWHLLSVLERGKLDELRTWLTSGSSATFVGQGPVRGSAKSAEATLRYRTVDEEIVDVVIRLQKGTHWQVVSVRQLPP